MIPPEGGAMGLEDRDYYREDYAKKNGMRYNGRNATYSKASRMQAVEEPIRNSGHEFSFLAKLVITLCVLLGSALAYRYLR